MWIKWKEIFNFEHELDEVMYPTNVFKHESDYLKNKRSEIVQKDAALGKESKLLINNPRRPLNFTKFKVGV